ncbi:MAG: HlyC/CorC family transporter [Catenulisporales bacterium]|nr:HlyC/CorC family transporter [Catenulisporales bacterium]
MSALLFWEILAVVALVLVAGVSACADAALSRVSRVRAAELVEAGVPKAARLKELVDDPARVLNLVLLLRVACETAATVVVAVLCVDRIDSAWGAGFTAIGIMIAVSYIFVGVMPRTIGRQHSLRVALAFAGPLALLQKILGPLAQLLIIVGNAVTPGRGFREGPFASEAELRALVDLAEANSVIEDEERRMVHSVFELGDTLVREVMVPRTDMVFIERHKTLRQALSLALRSGFSRIPVVGENADDVVGIVYLKDLVRRIHEHPSGETLEEVESVMRDPVCIPDSKPADELLRDMQAGHIHLAVVIDEYGGTAGLVTIEDILEEIVGEIADEYDVERPSVEHLSADAARVTARLGVDELGELFGVDLEDDDVETVGGLMAKRLGRVPIPGAQIELEGLRLTAESAEGRRRRIGTVLVKRLPPDGG